MVGVTLQFGQVVERTGLALYGDDYFSGLTTIRIPG
jgi:hypothetical protein